MSARLRMVLRMIVSILTPKERHEQSFSHQRPTTIFLYKMTYWPSGTIFDDVRKTQECFLDDSINHDSKESQEQSFKSSIDNPNDHQRWLQVDIKDINIAKHDEIGATL